MKLRAHVEGAWLDAARWDGMLAAGELLARRRRSSAVLCYHSVRPALPGDAPGFHPQDRMNVTPERFAEHLAYVTANFDVLRLDTLVDRWAANRPRPRRAVAITFDDAYHDVLVHAVPLLRRHGCPATVFVPTGHIDTDVPFWWDFLESWIGDCDRDAEFGGRTFRLREPAEKSALFERLRLSLTRAGPAMRAVLLRDAAAALAPRGKVRTTTMSWSEIEELDAEGLVSFGAHTVGHYAIAALSLPELRCELQDSVRELRRHVRHASRTFAYPYGRYPDLDPRADAILMGVGCRAGVTLLGGAVESSPSSFAINRIFMERDDDVLRLRAKLADIDAPFWAARRFHDVVEPTVAHLRSRIP